MGDFSRRQEGDLGVGIEDEIAEALKAGRQSRIRASDPFFICALRVFLIARMTHARIPGAPRAGGPRRLLATCGACS